MAPVSPIAAGKLAPAGKPIVAGMAPSILTPKTLCSTGYWAPLPIKMCIGVSDLEKKSIFAKSENSA